jgi:hypothetical protein
MKFVIAMTFLRNGSGADNEATQRRMLDAYSKWQAPAGMTFQQFLTRCDGSGGFAIVETDKSADLIDATSKFGAFIDYQIYPVVEVADGVQAAQEATSFLDSIS